MRYVALLRGIMPSNPNMRSEKLRDAFEALGFSEVATVIGSGNVVFSSDARARKPLEARIEDGLQRQLGFRTTAIVRSAAELKEFVGTDPFKGVRDEKPQYLIVTFFKDGRAPHAQVIDLDKERGTDAMQRIEKEFGKDITTRTWKTVHRILAKV